MRPARAVPPTALRRSGVNRVAAGGRPGATRSVLRPVRIMPPLRALVAPEGPSHRDVLRRWEELEWWSCAYCGADFGPKVVAEVDHIRPIAKGGLHEWPNLAPACRECNRAKSDRDMSDWLHICAGQDVT